MRYQIVTFRRQVASELGNGVLDGLSHLAAVGVAQAGAPEPARDKPYGGGNHGVLKFP